MIGGSSKCRFGEVMRRLLSEVTELEGYRGRGDHIVVMVITAGVIVGFSRLEWLELLIVEQALHSYQFRVLYRRSIS